LKGLTDVVQGPEYATAVGLVRHGLRSGAESGAVLTGPGGGEDAPAQGSGGGFMASLKRLFKDYF